MNNIYIFKVSIKQKKTHPFLGLDMQGNTLKAEMSVGSEKRRYVFHFT